MADSADVVMGSILGALVGAIIGVSLTASEQHPSDCGPTGPLVAVMREQEVNATCTITGVIMDARIELVTPNG